MVAGQHQYGSGCGGDHRGCPQATRTRLCREECGLSEMLHLPKSSNADASENLSQRLDHDIALAVDNDVKRLGRRTLVHQYVSFFKFSKLHGIHNAVHLMGLKRGKHRHSGQASGRLNLSPGL